MRLGRHIGAICGKAYQVEGLGLGKTVARWRSDMRVKVRSGPVATDLVGCPKPSGWYNKGVK